MILSFPVEYYYVYMLKNREHAFVLSYIKELASGLSKKQFHPNLVSSIFSFFTAVIDHYTPYLDYTIQDLFASSVHYWKSNLDELLQLVNNSNNLNSFSDYYGIIVEQLLYILYEDDYCDNDERVSVLIHLTQNSHSLQKYIHLALPAIQYVIEDHPNNVSIQLLGMNLFKDIVYYLDISHYYELVSSILGSMSKIRNASLIKDIVDIVCIIASKYSIQEFYPDTITILIKNRYFINSLEEVMENTPTKSTLNIHTEDHMLVSSNDLLYVLLPSLTFNQTVHHADSLLSEKEKEPQFQPNHPKQFNKYPIPFLFCDTKNMEKSCSHMYRFITSLLNQYSMVLYKYHYCHTNLALVKKAVRYCYS